MWRFLNSVPKQKPNEQDLPNPNQCNNSKEVAAVNAVVNETMKTISATKKRGSYANYDDQFRYKVARYAAENGDASAIKKFSKETKKILNESMVRTWRKLLINKESLAKMNLDKLEKEKRGRPLLLGIDLDKRVQQHIQLIRENGTIINRQIILATARGYVLNFNRSLLPEYGGNLVLTKDWADSIREHLGFVKRKGTKAARKLPDDFEKQKLVFHDRISKVVKEFEIPAQLVINWDQTGVNIIPVSDWTLAEKGAKQVSIIGLEDKRQIMALFASTLAGKLLPPQMLYQGKTPMCHPSVECPAGWDIWHSELHWSNESTMIRYAKKIIIPYCERKCQELLLPLDQEALVIFDVYKAHRSDDLFKLLEDNFIKYIFVPASCTSELQPLDAEGSVNGIFKTALKEQFNLWYSTELAENLKKGVKQVKLDLHLSMLKPMHFNWFVHAFDKVAAQSAVILAGWKKTGIFSAYENAFSPVVDVVID